MIIYTTAGVAEDFLSFYHRTVRLSPGYRGLSVVEMVSEKTDPYDFDNERGWRAYRILRPGRGMYHDVRRRLPYYKSDITDAWSYRTFAGTIRIYFVKSEGR